MRGFDAGEEASVAASRHRQVSFVRQPIGATTQVLAHSRCIMPHDHDGPRSETVRVASQLGIAPEAAGILASIR